MEKSKEEIKLDEFCCDFFKKNLHEYSWFSYEAEDNSLHWVMPCLINTQIRVNFCPTCGKKCRNIIVSDEVFNN